MTQTQLPTRLKKEPLIDAVFEMRVEAAAPLASLLPGLFRASLIEGEKLVPSRTQLASLPDEIRNADPQLRYGALVTMEWGLFRILVGDHMVAVGCKLPYPGWAKFREAISHVVKVLVDSKLVKVVDRYSVKYVDLIESDSLNAQIGSLNWSINIGGRQLSSEVAMLRSEFKIDDFQTIITVQTGAVVSSPIKQGVRGLILDVDSIFNSHRLAADEFLSQLGQRIDAIHSSNKRTFFECLTGATVESLEPEYGG
ncbi:TIGR04255 family protein [Hydrogenophaga sp. SNF1]|uniref:TIGR04255 family protein n=1 Tax=Hydrogenophaga sp. SNF1 TaxID=3098762 RepID=UPI002ACC0A8A|nr:TIGR04255 family protein [Hydrogenophaga sp. SNF1]WQB82349.1 TIGR04255 family protein [Hydrogenophaga sp. SNF1]